MEPEVDLLRKDIPQLRGRERSEGQETQREGKKAWREGCVPCETLIGTRSSTSYQIPAMEPWASLCPHNQPPLSSQGLE